VIDLRYLHPKDLFQDQDMHGDYACQNMDQIQHNVCIKSPSPHDNSPLRVSEHLLRVLVQKDVKHFECLNDRDDHVLRLVYRQRTRKTKTNAHSTAPSVINRRSMKDSHKVPFAKALPRESQCGHTSALHTITSQEAFTLFQFCQYSLDQALELATSLFHDRLCEQQSAMLLSSPSCTDQTIVIVPVIECYSMVFLQQLAPILYESAEVFSV
jgi:hypothetical protein